MAGKLTTNVRRDREDGEALPGWRKDGRAAPDLARTEAAARYRHRRPPMTGLFVSTDVKLGDEDELVRDREQ